MFFKKSDYDIVAKSDDKIEVCIKATNQTITVTREVGEVILDLNNEQYNSDHKFDRHQDKFLTAPTNNEDTNPINELADRSSIEFTSTYSNEHLLDSIIAAEDAAERQQLINQLPAALATLTDKQSYVITHYYFNQIKKKEIAKKMGISAMMVTKHEKSAISKLQKFYKINKK